MDPTHEFRISISGADVRKILIKQFNSPHAEVIVDAIFANVKDEDHFVSLLVNILNGNYPRVDYKVGQEVWIDKHALSLWRISEEKMEEAGMIFKDHIKGTIESIDLYNKYGIKVNYSCLDKLGQTTTENAHVRLDSICPCDSIPGEPAPGEDLPF